MPACHPDMSWAPVNQESYIWPTKQQKWLTFDKIPPEKWLASRPNFTDQDCSSLAVVDPDGTLSIVTADKDVLDELVELSVDPKDATEVLVNSLMP